MEVTATKATIINAMRKLNPNTSTFAWLKPLTETKRFAKADMDSTFAFVAHAMDVWMFA